MAKVIVGVGAKVIVAIGVINKGGVVLYCWVWCLVGNRCAWIIYNYIRRCATKIKYAPLRLMSTTIDVTETIWHGMRISCNRLHFGL